MNSSLKQDIRITRDLFKPVWLIVAIAIYSGTIALGNFLIIKPQIKQFQVLKAQRDELDSMVTRTNFHDIDKTLSTLENAISLYQDQQQLFDAKVLPKNEISNILSELNTIVESSQLTLRFINPLPSAGKILRKYQKAPITMRLNGDYHNFLRLLDELEHSKYWLLIDNFSIEPANKDNEYSFILNIYTITN
jgi:Tfp pilus assembly protein PilO